MGAWIPSLLGELRPHIPWGTQAQTLQSLCSANRESLNTTVKTQGSQKRQRTALLRYNSPTLKLPHLKIQVSGFQCIHHTLCNHDHSRFQNTFVRKVTGTHQQSLSHPFPPQPLATTDPLYFSMDAPVLDVSCRWSRIVWGFWGPASFSWHSGFKAHPVMACVSASSPRLLAVCSQLLASQSGDLASNFCCPLLWWHMVSAQ